MIMQRSLWENKNTIVGSLTQAHQRLTKGAITTCKGGEKNLNLEAADKWDGAES